MAPRVRYPLTQLITPTLGGEVPGFEPAAWQPYPSRLGKRLTAPMPERSSAAARRRGGASARDLRDHLGFTDIVEVDQGLYAIITDWPSSTISTTWAECIPGQFGYLYVGLEGDGRVNVEGLGPARRSGRSCALTLAPPGSTMLWRVGPSVTRHGLCLAFHSSYLRRQYPQLLARCGDAFGAWLADQETQLRDFELPLPPLVTTATAALLASRLEGEARYRFVSGTAQQILSLALAAIADRSLQTPRLSPREREVVQRVRTALDEHLDGPPRLEDLAKRFGLNRTKLRFGFKALFGVTAENYLLEQRMRLAYELLQRHSLSVTEIAARVGYAHLCNFTTAFKRRFGRSPSQVARGA